MKELSVIIPTYNEINNIQPIVKLLERSLKSVNFELIFVDDNSPDGTINEIKKISKVNKKVRYILRFDKSGLSSAVTDGIVNAESEICVVMDGDLQHDEKIIPIMYKKIIDEKLDLVVGSRFKRKNDSNSLNAKRFLFSKIGNLISNSLLIKKLTDPMSGFFMIRRNIFVNMIPHLSQIGFKILLDIIISSEKKINFKEIEFKFRKRNSGDSKLNYLIFWDYFLMLIDKKFGKLIPVRFISYCLIGLIGASIHIFSFLVLFKLIQLNFFHSYLPAMLISMTSNFFINNALTFRHDQLIKLKDLMRGLFLYYIICSFGAFSNIMIATNIYNYSIFSNLDFNWIIATFTGLLISSVWNYLISSRISWRIKR